jgi:transcriptional regulator with XRE-family HTH domain
MVVMRLGDWMEANGYSVDDGGDARLASRIKSDRTTVSRIRRGKLRPGWRLADIITRVTAGEVTPNDYAAPAETKPRRKRAA